MIFLNLDDGLLFLLQQRDLQLRVGLVCVVGLLDLIQLSLVDRHRLDDGVFDVRVKFIREVRNLRIAKAYIWKIEEHHDDLIFCYHLRLTKVENDKNVLV